jgi:hypothetical protein
MSVNFVLNWIALPIILTLCIAYWLFARDFFGRRR